MTSRQPGWIKTAKTLLPAIACSALVCLVSQAAFAQAGDNIRMQYPQLADLFNAFNVTQAQTFEAIATINVQPVYTSVRAELREHLELMKRMTRSELMAVGVMDRSPYLDMEIAARINLLAVMRATHSDEEAANAYTGNAAIGRHASEILRRGRTFENRLFEIYIDDNITDKRAAVNVAITHYLSDDRHSVSSSPRASKILIEHDQATGFKTAFPRLSALMWTQQWLQLAALEAVILKTLDKQFSRGVETALERFWNKIGTEGGMSMFPPPSELPMAPAIAPDLYTQSPEAAIILDNLNILETVLADILSYPDAEGREAKMDTAVALFTNKAADDSPPAEYLLFALRGGIYNQGGPVVGELMRSERNRSRGQVP
ncbi:MAG: hypothetical protein Q8L20_07350 [Gammaproteobacteria bacterium]|nr:hypothetical protein [Gammaproteobacteria bacterium]